MNTICIYLANLHVTIKTIHITYIAQMSITVLVVLIVADYDG
jgi:hypothetical protein